MSGTEKEGKKGKGRNQDWRMTEPRGVECTELSAEERKEVGITSRESKKEKICRKERQKKRKMEEPRNRTR